MANEESEGPEEPEESDIKPIDPSRSDAWLFFKHSDSDLGERPAGWAEHNGSYMSRLADGVVTIDFELGNSGWADATLFQLDFFIPVDGGWVMKSHNVVPKRPGEPEGAVIASGATVEAHYEFDAGPGYAEDGASGVMAPSIVMRLTTLTSVAPSSAQILACLLSLASDGSAAIAQLREWKRFPGFFAYPCCALFP